MYHIELFYGWQETEHGTYHSFLAADPDHILNDDMGEELAEQLDTNTNDERFSWSSMPLSLPDSLIHRISQEAITNYLERGNASSPAK